jgi:hypothetical protein
VTVLDLLMARAALFHSLTPMAPPAGAPPALVASLQSETGNAGSDDGPSDLASCLRSKRSVQDDARGGN